MSSWALPLPTAKVFSANFLAVATLSKFCAIRYVRIHPLTFITEVLHLVAPLGSLYTSFYGEYGINFGIFAWDARRAVLLRPHPPNLSLPTN